jgi:transcriptional regulator with XRE-family HTH domain
MTISPSAMVRGFGSSVRQLRDARGWSQEELADHSGLNRSFVGEIERGEVTVSLSTVAKLARAFDTLPSLLVKRGESLGVAQDARETRTRLMAIDG